MARRYDVHFHRRPRISVGWTVALVIVVLAGLRSIYPPLAVAVVVFGLVWAAAVAIIRGWNRGVAQRDGEDTWGRRR